MISAGIGIGALIVLLMGLLLSFSYRSMMKDHFDMFQVLGAMAMAVAAKFFYFVSIFIGLIAFIVYLCGS